MDELDVNSVNETFKYYEFGCYLGKANAMQSTSGLLSVTYADSVFVLESVPTNYVLPSSLSILEKMHLLSRAGHDFSRV